MSTANVWSDDSDAYPNTHNHPTNDGLSHMAHETWMQFSSNIENDDARPAEMDVDEDSFHAPANVATWQDLYLAGDDQDDEMGDVAAAVDAHVDILAVTNVLSQGMVAEDDEYLTPFQGAAPVGNHFGADHFLTNLYPAPPPPPVQAHHPQMLHPPLPAFPPHMINHVPLQVQGTFQGIPQNGFNANNANVIHMQLNQPVPAGNHPQNLHPNAVSNPNLNALGPENYNLYDFIRIWAYQYVSTWRGPHRDGRYPWPKRIGPQLAHPISEVGYMDLEGDRCDVQGIDWDDLGVTRSDARERRLLTYKNYVNVANSDRWQETHDVLPCTENYFRFRCLDVRKNINLAHFQLRNVLASTSRSQVFYPGNTSVYEFNATTGKGKPGLRSKETPHFQASTLAAAHGVLVAGGFLGEYCFRETSSGSTGEVHEGTITTDNSGITNHVQVHLSRSSAGPKAAFASNDNGFRVLDIETERFISETYYGRPINCTAMSPDLRLRVVVGDQTQVLITKAEPDGKPEILHALDGHGDFGFSCAWADDGWTVATGFQDKAVKIWDARRWTDVRGKATPVCTLRSEMAGCRSLKFSPLGSGKRVLVAAEEADFVNIYDAQTWQSKQTFDFFGEIGGTTFVNEGRDLQILCCDRTRGGIFQLERCGLGAERNHDLVSSPWNRVWKNESYDWPEHSTMPRVLPRHSETSRRRRALAADYIDPF